METKRGRGRPKKVEEDEGTFSITLQLGDVVTQGTGSSMFEALQSIPKPMKIVSKGTVTLSNGVKTRTLAYTPVQIKRLFFPLAQKVIAKQFSYGMV